MVYCTVCAHTAEALPWRLWPISGNKPRKGAVLASSWMSRKLTDRKATGFSLWVLKEELCILVRHCPRSLEALEGTQTCKQTAVLGSRWREFFTRHRSNTEKGVIGYLEGNQRLSPWGAATWAAFEGQIGVGSVGTGGEKEEERNIPTRG